jgi:hypothetical protein
MSAMKQFKNSIGSKDLKNFLMKEKNKTKENDGIIIENLEEINDGSFSKEKKKNNNNKNETNSEIDSNSDQKNMKYTISSLDLMKLLKKQKSKTKNNEEEETELNEISEDSELNSEEKSEKNNDQKNMKYIINSLDLIKLLKKEKSKTKNNEEEDFEISVDFNEYEENENKSYKEDEGEKSKKNTEYTISSIDLLKFLKMEKFKNKNNEKEKLDNNENKKDNEEKLEKNDSSNDDIKNKFDLMKYLKKEKSKTKVKEEENDCNNDESENEMDNDLGNLKEEINNKKKDNDEKSDKSSNKKNSMKYTIDSLDLMKYLKKEKTKDSINEEGNFDRNDDKKINRDKLGKYDNTMEDLIEMFDIIKYLKKEKSKSKVKEEEEEGNNDDDEMDNYLKNLKEEINNKEKDDDEKSNKSSKKKSSMKYAMNSLDLMKFLKKEKTKDSFNEEEKSDIDNDEKNNKEKPEKSDSSKDEIKDLLDLMKYLKKEKSKTKNKEEEQEEEQEENPETNNDFNINSEKSEKSNSKYSINSLDLMKFMKKEKTKDSIIKNENNNEINNNKKNNKDKITKNDEKKDNKGKSYKDNEKKNNKNKTFKDDEKEKNKNKTSINDEKKDNNSKIFKNNEKMDDKEKPKKNDSPMEELMYKLDLIRYLKKEKSKTSKMKKEVKVEENIENNNDLKSTNEKIDNQKSTKYMINSLDLMKFLKKEKSKSKVNEEMKNETDKKNNNSNNSNNNNKENPEKNENPLDDLMELLEQNIDLEDFRKKMEKFNNYTGLNFLYNYYYYEKPEVTDIERRNGLKGIEEKIIKINDFKTIKEKIKLIKHLINSHLIKTVDDIKVFLKENEITIKELNSLKVFDLLIYLIEGQTGYITIPLIKHVVSYTYYKNLNYTIFSNKFGVRSPLLSAIINKNYRAADFLIKRGADINFKINSINVLYYLLNNQFLDKSTLKYLINNGYDVAVMDSFIINNLSNDYINIIFNYGIFDNTFVLRMLHGYKKQIPLSNAHIQFLVEREKKKIKIQNDWYFEAFSKSDYAKIDLLFTNEIIPNESKINDIIYKIFSIVDIYDMKNHSDKKYEFREAIENKELKQFQKMSKEFLDDVSLPNIEQKRNMIKEIMKEDNFERLIEYVKRNNIMTKDLNDEHFDILIYAIENGVSFDNIYEIIKLAQYHIFDYKIIDDESKDFKTPFLVAISNRRYDVIDFLINNEVNIHKHLITMVDDKPCNDLINYLCRNKKLNYQSLIYIFSKLDNSKEDYYVAPESFNYLIESSKNKEAEFLINKFSLPIVDDWYKKAAQVENFGFIDMAFEHDTREFDKKSEILQTILAENLHPMKIAEFMKYTKHTKIKDIYRETMISIFQGEFGKLLS